jgi:hypothetical protein
MTLYQRMPEFTYWERNIHKKEIISNEKEIIHFFFWISRFFDQFKIFEDKNNREMDSISHNNRAYENNRIMSEQSKQAAQDVRDYNFFKNCIIRMFKD